MATSFGEIIFPISRAYIDDDYSDDEMDNEEKNNSCLILDYLSASTNHEEYDLIVVLDGFAASAFANNYVLCQDDKIIATVKKASDCSTNSEQKLNVLKNPEYLNILQLKKNEKILVLKSNPKADIRIVNEFTNMAEPFLKKCKQLLILASRSNSEFHCESLDYYPSACMRKIITNPEEVQLNNNILYLEQPNFVSGFSASVSSWCEAFHRTCELYVCYLDSIFIDSISVQPFIDLFQKSSKLKQILNETKVNFQNDNPNDLANLYL